MNNYAQLVRMGRQVAALDDVRYEEEELRAYALTCNNRFLTAYRKQESYTLQVLHGIKGLFYAAQVSESYYEHFLWHLDLTFQIGERNYKDFEQFAFDFFVSYTQADGCIEDQKATLEQILEHYS